MALQLLKQHELYKQLKIEIVFKVIASEASDDFIRPRF